MPELAIEWTVIDLKDRELDASLHSGVGSTDDYGGFEVQLVGRTAEMIAQLPPSRSSVRLELRLVGAVATEPREVEIPTSLFRR